MIIGLTCVYVVFLYSMIPFARPLQRLLEKRLGFWFELGIVLIYICCLAGSITYFRFIRKDIRVWKYGLLVVIWAVLAFFIDIIEIPVEKIHFLEYAVLGMFLSAIFSCKNITSIVKTVVIGFLVGLGDEMLQGLCPTRFFDWRDVGMNVIGVGIGLIYMVTMINKRANPKQVTGNR